MAADGKSKAQQTTKSWKTIQNQVQSLTKKAQEAKSKNEKR